MADISANFSAAAEKKTSFISKSIASLGRYLEGRRTFNALNALTDRELDDIGIRRGEIDQVAWHLRTI